MRVGTQRLFRPYLKTFVPPFLLTRLTDPGSPRMRNTSTCTSLCSLQVQPFFKKELLNLELNKKSIYLLFAVLLTEPVIPSAFVQMQRELHLGAALVVQEVLERHQHSLWVHHLLTDLSTHPIFQKAVEDNHQ